MKEVRISKWWKHLQTIRQRKFCSPKIVHQQIKEDNDNNINDRDDDDDDNNDDDADGDGCAVETYNYFSYFC